MIKVKIAGAECDIAPTKKILLSFDGASLSDLERGRSGYSISFKMELNPTNSAIFGNVEDIHPLIKFNSEWHEMTIEMDGLTLVRGTAYLMQTLWESGKHYIVVECRSGVVSWVDGAARKLFKNINLPFSTRLTESNFKQGWTDNSPVKFFPVTRDSYSQLTPSGDATGVRLLRSLDDYHPFIQVSTLVEAILGDEGYTLESTTQFNESFEDLYISGNYNYGGSSAAKQEAMGFFAKRTESVSTETSTLGEVDFSPYMAHNSVGNIIDLESIEREHECFNHGGCLQLDNKALIYRPITAASVGFEIYLHYTCDCYIESRTKLKGIDSYDNFDQDYAVKWELSNRYIDQRDELQQGVQYKLFIFDFDEDYEYRLLGEDADGAMQEVVPWSSNRVTSKVIDGDYTNLKLYERRSGTISLSQKDWALYFGFVEEMVPTEVRVTFRTQAQECSPTSPLEFQFAKLKGAMAGADLTLHEDCSMRPFFSAYPSFNSVIAYEDIAQLSCSALDFLSSLQHLFNLRFFTNDSTKRVIIESFDTFYNSESWDWSDKVMQDESIEFSDLAHLDHRRTTLGYQMGDGAVKRLGSDQDEIFGRWSVVIDSYAASPATHTLLNPLFSASMSDENGVLQVGDRDDVDSVDSLSFSPRIAKFIGMRELEGENYEIPYVAFHSPEDEFTLCFEDRDQVPGLNRLYKREFKLKERSQIISLSLRLTACDFANLFETSGVGASLRSIFRLKLHGESFRATLHSIESFDLVTGVARCKFLTID